MSELKNNKDITPKHSFKEMFKAVFISGISFLLMWLFYVCIESSLR